MLASSIGPVIIVGFNNLSLNRITSHTWNRIFFFFFFFFFFFLKTDACPNKKIANATEIMLGKAIGDKLRLLFVSVSHN